MASSYQRDFQEAKKKLNDLLLAKEQIETRIARQKRRVAALAELCDADDESDSSDSGFDLDLGGLTEACITVLRGSRKEWLNTSEIQQSLRDLGFPIQTYKAPNASIATTVNRLVDDGVVVADKRLATGAIEYKWVGKIPTLMDQLTAERNQLATKGGTGVISRDVIRKGLRTMEERLGKK